VQSLQSGQEIMMQGGAPQVDWGHRDFPEILEKAQKT